MPHRLSISLCLLCCVMVSFVASAETLNEARVRAYYQAWSSGDVDQVMPYFASTIVYEDVATGERAAGTAEVRAFAAKFLSSTPGVQVEPGSVLVGPTSAAVEWTMSAGEGEAAWSVRGVAIIDHADGLITRATDYWNAE